MKTLKSLVSWIEIPVLDMPRARKFYEAILEVELEEMPLGDLTMAFFSVDKGSVSGALCKHEQFYKPSQDGVTIYLTASPNIESFLKRVNKANGAVLMQKKLISPEIGYMTMFSDSEGNRIALYETINN